MNTSGMSTHTITPTGKFFWQVKREFWEYRGGFLWTPLIIAAVMLAFVAMGIIIAEINVRENFNLNGIHLNQLASHLDADAIAKFQGALDVALLSMGLPIRIALFVVVFFYALGALYNDRADRSVLFWKSLPLSDTQSVLAKVAAGLIIAPALAALGMIALQLGFLILLSLYAAFHGINALPYLWSPTHLIAMWVKLAVLIPVNALWALPTMGWLLLCSSYARSKPFLWAMTPLIAGVIVSWAQLTGSFSFGSWFWRHIVGRLLLSLIPESWINLDSLRALEHANADPGIALGNLLSFGSIADQFASPNFLIGVAAGAVMIAAAIWLRRSRVEAYA
jgi:ABC-2 type transport system permease protein